MEVYEDGTLIGNGVTKSANNLGDVYTFATKADSSYELKPKDGLHKVTLVSVTPSTAVTGAEMGAPKTVEALGLPSKVEINTDQKNTQADVIWDLDNVSYNPALIEAQIFTINGTVVLPDGIENPNDVSLSTSIKISVNKVPQSQMTATATSEEVQEGDVASNAIDGNPNTMWHTKWDKSDVLPQSITLNLGGTYNIDKIADLPRPGGGNGTITAYNIHTSTDGVTFTKVASGNWSNNSSEKSVILPLVNASFIKLEAIEAVNGWATAAEINVI